MRFLTWYRAGLLVMTNFAILAVDFHVFPRRFAKAEVYGSGLMDVGTGSFVFAQGLVRGSASHRPQQGDSSSGRRQRQTWRSALLTAGPLFLIGAARMAAVKSVEYQEHFSEYGVHWNFFMTLAAVVLLAKVLPVPEQPEWRAAAGAVVAVAHQAMLLGGLGEVALSDQRGPGLLSLNKEGLISLPGYFALHCLGWGAGGAGRAVLRLRTAGLLPGLVATMAAACISLWLATVASRGAVEPVCRRSCNLAYILWVAAHNCSALSVFLLADILGRDSTGSWRPMLGLAGTLSDHMLEAFLIANLLTGAVNLSIDTLQVGATAAGYILVGYMLLQCLLVQLLRSAKLGVRRRAASQSDTGQRGGTKPE